MNKFLIFVLTTFVCVSSFAAQLTPEMRTYASHVAKEGKISKRAVLSWLKRAKVTEGVVDLMDRQTEGKQWKDYKPLFINKKKIEKGVWFARRYPRTLAKARRIFGVEPDIIVAILGVETDYGTYALSHRAMDALFTLAFHYPRREKYFRGELAALMIYAYRNRLDPFNLKSSYAGAVGMPQFMPSNIIKYGREFSGDGRINIFKSGADSIGSVANYLKKHGWKRHRPIAVKAYTRGTKWKKYLDKGIKPKFTVRELRRAGVIPSMPVLSKRKAALVELEGEEGTEHWLLFNNFYAITRYNPSVKYALAVTILAKHIEISSRR